MEKQALINFLKGKRNGTYATVVYGRELESLDNNLVITKVSSIHCRLGVRYENISGVVYMGTHPFTFSEGICSRNGKDYLMIATTKNPFHNRNNTFYYCNGEVITKAQAMLLTKASEWKKHKDAVVMTLKLSNILAIR